MGFIWKWNLTAVKWFGQANEIECQIRPQSIGQNTHEEIDDKICCTYDKIYICIWRNIYQNKHMKKYMTKYMANEIEYEMWPQSIFHPHSKYWPSTGAGNMTAGQIAPIFQIMQKVVYLQPSIHILGKEEMQIFSVFFLLRKIWWIWTIKHGEYGEYEPFTGEGGMVNLYQT